MTKLGPLAVQVKQEPGTLRFSIDHADGHIHALYAAAERQSSLTCEQCGKADTPHDYPSKNFAVPFSTVLLLCREFLYHSHFSNPDYLNTGITSWQHSKKPALRQDSIQNSQ